MRIATFFRTSRWALFPRLQLRTIEPRAIQLRTIPLWVIFAFLPATLACAAAHPASAADHAQAGIPGAALALTPPMGWNDWAHYQCGFTAQTILANARALEQSGLAAAGYNTVTIDDCWMRKDRDARGNLQADRDRFPEGMKPVAAAIHAMGLKFGIYEDAGYATCGGFAGSGEPAGGGNAHFLQDALLFASWGVDYLKLDGCNLYSPRDANQAAAYRKAYAAENAAIKAAGRRIVFSESAPAYFQGLPAWYDVLSWVRGYGQLWREGDDIGNFDAHDPSRARFPSVLWNYSYNLPLGRFQKPGNWDDPDFIIGGDGGMSLAETRSQLALWSMMSAPLILSSQVAALTPQSLAVLGNRAVIAVDQDRLGKMATLLRRNPAMDVLLKRLAGGDYAVAVLNRGASPLPVNLRPMDLGFPRNSGCNLDVRELWSGTHLPASSALHADLAVHDTAIWRIHPSPSCGAPARSGTVTMTAAGEHRDSEGYTRCLAAPGLVEDCAGTRAETWTMGAHGALKAGGLCLTAADGKAIVRACTGGDAQRWLYTLDGNLRGTSGKCLTAGASAGPSSSLSLQACGHNLPNQIWSLPIGSMPN